MSITYFLWPIGSGKHCGFLFPSLWLLYYPSYLSQSKHCVVNVQYMIYFNLQTAFTKCKVLQKVWKIYFYTFATLRNSVSFCILIFWFHSVSDIHWQKLEEQESKDRGPQRWNTMSQKTAWKLKQAASTQTYSLIPLRETHSKAKALERVWTWKMMLGQIQ